MEDFEEMQHREAQRQELLEEFKRLVWEQIFDCDIAGGRLNETAFYWGLMAGATQYPYPHSTMVKSANNIFYESALNLFRDKVVPKIEVFTPVRAEREFLVVKFLEFVHEWYYAPVHREILP